MRLRRLLFALLATVTALFFLPVAPARAGDDNAAVAVNTKDGSSVFKIAFDIRRITDGQVDPQNAAVAYSNCDECQTVAVAIQIVLVVGDANEVAPTNVAISYNEDCESCATMAAAYQFVYGNGDDVRFSPEGKRRLNEIRKRLHGLRKMQGLTLDQINAALQSITDDIAAVLNDELKPVAATGDTTTTSTTLDGGGSGSSTSSSSTSTSAPEVTTTSPTTSAP